MRGISYIFPIKIPDKAICQHCHMLDMSAAGRAWQKRGTAGLKRPAEPARKSAAEMGEKRGVSKPLPIKIPQKQLYMLTFYSAGITPQGLAYILPRFTFQPVTSHLTFLIHIFQYGFINGSVHKLIVLLIFISVIFNFIQLI